MTRVLARLVAEVDKGKLRLVKTTEVTGTGKITAEFEPVATPTVPVLPRAVDPVPKLP